MLFYLWSNKYNKWWREGAWGYSEDISERGLFLAGETIKYLINGLNDLAWVNVHDEPKTIALGQDGRWYSLVEYDGPLPDGGTPMEETPEESVSIVDANLRTADSEGLQEAA